MKVLILCNAGMSTSLLTNSMRQHAEEGDIVDAQPVGELVQYIDDYDVFLLGPQIRFRLKEVQKMVEAKGKHADMIDPRAYGMMDGKAAMELARKTLAGK